MGGFNVALFVNNRWRCRLLSSKGLDYESVERDAKETCEKKWPREIAPGSRAPIYFSQVSFASRSTD